MDIFIMKYQILHFQQNNQNIIVTVGSKKNILGSEFQHTHIYQKKDILTQII